jgi:hypothetical protein
MKSTIAWYLAIAGVSTLGFVIFEKHTGVSFDGVSCLILGILCGLEASIGYLMGKYEKDDD